MSNKSVKIVLNAMVKNEAAVIERMLESAYKHIDYWVIQDNGSTDGTQDIIKSFFESKNIPGVLYYEPWQYPGYNRNHTLQYCLQANHGCDYILRMDADEILEVDDDFDWDIINSHDAWNVVARSGNFDYYRMWLWKAGLPWYFAEDKRHETIHIKDNGAYSMGNLPIGFRHVLLPGGITWENKFKFFIDALELENQTVTQQECSDMYHLFYVGKSYNDAVNPEIFPFKLDHAKEIVWQKAFNFDPIRNESLMRLCDYYLNHVDDIPNLYLYSNIAVRNNYPFPNKRVVWIEKDSYTDTGWSTLDYFIISTYHMGYYQESFDAAKLLLSDLYKNILPTNQRHRIESNLNCARSKLQ